MDNQLLQKEARLRLTNPFKDWFLVRRETLKYADGSVTRTWTFLLGKRVEFHVVLNPWRQQFSVFRDNGECGFHIHRLKVCWPDY